MFMELVKDEHELLTRQLMGTVTHEEYRVYEALMAMSDILLDLDDYLYASREKSEKFIVLGKKKATE